MNQLSSFVFSVLFVLNLGAVFAQQCGTTVQSQYEMREHMFEIRAKRKAALQNGIANPRGADTKYLPVKFHLVGQTDSSLVISESRILNMICELNNKFADQNIVFYIKHPFNYIYNSSLDNNPNVFNNPTAEFHILDNKVDDAINIFITGSAGGTTTLGFYQPPFPEYDFIVVRRSAVTGNTAPHEMGHFFALAHTFFGWEAPSDPSDNPYYPDAYEGWSELHFGNPVGDFSPSYDLQSVIPNEKMDQSNCLQASDGICDTPPDYLFAYSSDQNGCNPWTGGALDPNGDLCDPMENNMMSYFSQCGSYEFTEEQKDVIWWAVTESPWREYLQHDYIPSTDLITDVPELIYPIDGETTPAYNIVNFEWNPIAGATHYLLEIDFLPTFTGLPNRFIIENESTAEIEDIFDPNNNYYWRVRPYSDGYTCGMLFSDSGNFETGEDNTNTFDFNLINDWSVIPNPVSTSETLMIQMKTNEAFEAGISLYSINGQQIRNVENHLFAGDSINYELDIRGIHPGIYVITIQSEAGMTNKKVVITQ